MVSHALQFSMGNHNGIGLQETAWVLAGISWSFLSKLAIDALRGKLSLNEVGTSLESAHFLYIPKGTVHLRACLARLLLTSL